MFVSQKNIFTIHLQVVSHAVLCCERRAKQNYSAHTMWRLFNNCSHRVFYHRPILCCHNYVLQYLGNNNVFQYIAEAHKKPPPRAICYLPATLAGHPPNKHPSTLCTNNREIEHQLYLRIWPVKDRNATTMAPVEGCLLNVTRNRAQRLRH